MGGKIRTLIEQSMDEEAAATRENRTSVCS